MIHHPRLLHVLLADRSVTATRSSHHPARRSRVIGCHQSAQSGNGSRLCPLGRHRNVCCMVLPAAAAIRLDEHKGTLQHIHDRNNHNTPQNASRNLELTHTRRICSLWQGCHSPLVAGLRLATLSYLEPTHKQTNQQTCKQPTNPSNEPTNTLTVTRSRHKRLLRPWWRWCLMMRCWRRGRRGICGTCRRLGLATSMAALWSAGVQMARSSSAFWTTTSACGRYVHALALFVSCPSYCGMVATRHLWQGCDSPHCHMSCGRVVTRNVAWLACCHIIDA